MIVIYGILINGIHTDTSNTEKGAKNYATRNGFFHISKRIGYNAFLISEKIENKWKNKKY